MTGSSPAADAGGVGQVRPMCPQEGMQEGRRCQPAGGSAGREGGREDVSKTTEEGCALNDKRYNNSLFFCCRDLPEGAMLHAPCLSNTKLSLFKFKMTGELPHSDGEH